ncbi:MAG: hypothetical protein ABID61_04030 [Candidatus Micrarchaeota archaeon]
MTRKGGQRAAAKPVVLEGGVKAPDLSRVAKSIQDALGASPGSVGKTLTEGLMAVRDETIGSVNTQLDGLRADTSAARESAREAAKKAKEAAAYAGETITSAKSANEGAAAASQAAAECAESAATTERAAGDVRDSIRSLSVTVGEKIYEGDEALHQIGQMLSTLAGVSLSRGETAIHGVEAVKDVVATVDGLSIKRGNSEIKGPDALRELVAGLASIEMIVERPSAEGESKRETVAGIDALIMLCGRVDNLESGFVGHTDRALTELLSANVEVGRNEDGTTKYQQVTGVQLIMHVFRAADALIDSLSAEAKTAVEEVFTAKVTRDGREVRLSGAELAQYLVEVAETARTSAGAAVRQTTEAASNAERSAAEARQAADGAYTAADQAGKKADVLADAVAVIDEKLAVLAELVAVVAKKLGVTTFFSNVMGGETNVSDVSALMADSSIEKPGETPGKSG